MKTIVLFAFIWISHLTLTAQPSGERIEALKVSYITQQLNLTPEEAQAFWPVYNAFQDKLKAIRDQRSQILPRPLATIDRMSDEALRNAMNKFWQLEQQELNLKKEYNDKFLAILPVKKVVMLQVAEQRFKLLLLNELRKRRNGEGRLLKR